MFRPTVANIHLDRLKHNARVLKSMVNEGDFFCPMIKGNAYGHGDVAVAKALISEGHQTFGVALVEEGVRLREAHLNDCKILMFSPCVDQKSLQAIQDYKLTPVISSWEELKIIETYFAKSNFRIHLKFNTGMSRLGFAISEAPRLAEYIKRNVHLTLEGICSHLLTGEDLVNPKARTASQEQSVQAISNYFSGMNLIYHLYNSAALISHHCHRSKENLKFGVRPGLSLYGVKPQIECRDRIAQDKWQAIDLKPVMDLKSQITHLQNISVGETVSYDGLFTATQPTLIGVVPIGYADGYMRNLSTKSQVICEGQKLDVLGIICMDYTMINLNPYRDLKTNLLNKEVILMGEDRGQKVTAEELAELAHTNAYEVLTQVSARVPRVYI